jgi:hypothetical protein
MLLIALLVFNELCHTSGFIDIPTAPQYDVAKMVGGSFTLSLPIFAEDPDPADDQNPDPADFTMTFRYGIGGKTEIALSMYHYNTYVLSLSYLIKAETKSRPAFFCGIDDISYGPYISTIGMKGEKGFLEEKNYYNDMAGRAPEIFSAYIAGQKSFPPLFNFVLGLGRGRFVGYGGRSHLLNTDFFVIGEGYKDHNVNPSVWAFGVFFGASVKFPYGLEFIAEIDGRDGNAGLKYHHKYFTGTLALCKCEHFGAGRRPWSPRIAIGLESNNRFRLESSKVGYIECIIRDIKTKTPLINSMVDIKEINRRYKAKTGTFGASLPPGSYTIRISKSGYVDHITNVLVKAGLKTKLVFNLHKTQEALKAEEKKHRIKTYLKQGKTYYYEDNLGAAKVAFRMVLSLDPSHAEAQAYLANIEPRRQELITRYTTEAQSSEAAKALPRAIEFWQKVLALDPENMVAKTAISKLQKQLVPTKEPPTKKPAKKLVGKKSTKEEVESLYKKGVTYFAAERYDDALKLFKRVLVLNPNHKGARDYKKRTEARIEVLKEGG